MSNKGKTTDWMEHLHFFHTELVKLNPYLIESWRKVINLNKSNSDMAKVAFYTGLKVFS